MQYDPARRSLYYPETGEPLKDFSTTWQTGQICAELSRLCYYRFDDAEPAPRETLESALAAAGFSFPEYFIATEEDAQAFGTTANGITYVVFRGTQGGKPGDLGTDLKAPLIQWPGRGRVHQGFCETYLSLRPMIDTWLAGTAGNHLVVTGHSLGAAMATLMAALHDAAELITFGSPRVGDDAFAAQLAGRRMHRYVDCDDAVTMVPPELIRYVHAGDMTYIDRHGIVHARLPDPEVIAEDRRIGRNEYRKKHAWKVFRNVLTRRLADHAPINYVSAVLGRREPSL